MELVQPMVLPDSMEAFKMHLHQLIPNIRRPNMTQWIPFAVNPKSVQSQITKWIPASIRVPQIQSSALVPDELMKAYQNSKYILNHTSIDTVSAKLDQGVKYIDHVDKEMKHIKQVLRALIPDLFKDIDISKDWSEVAPKIIHNIEDNVRFISNAIKDPGIRKALQNAIGVYGNVFKEIYKLDEPLIQEMTDSFWKTVNTISEKSSRNASNAVVQSGMAVVAEIPGLGGAVDLLVASGKWFNTVASGIIAPGMIQLGDATNKTMQIGSHGMAVAKKYETKLRVVDKELSEAIQNIQSKTSATLNTFQPKANILANRSSSRGNNQSGGKRTKPLKSKQTAKRLIKSISAFTRCKHN